MLAGLDVLRDRIDALADRENRDLCGGGSKDSPERPMWP